MPNLIDIRRRIKSVKNTQQITKAMKMISASRLRRATERATNARPYARRLFDLHASVSGKMTDFSTLTEETASLYRREEGRTLLVVIAGDKGLCSSFNSNIFKRAEKIIKREGVESFAVLPIGKKAGAYFKRHSVTTLKVYSDIFRSLTFTIACAIAEEVMTRFRQGEFAKVILVFNKFKNVLVQEVTEMELLPLASGSQADQGGGLEHLAEPGIEEILQELTPNVVRITVFQALQESCAAEHAARMTAMDSATINAKDMIEKLTLEMNKARQAAITKELIEVVSGAAAL